MDNLLYPRYLVSPVLLKQDSERGKKIFYSLSNNARIRLNLKLPILREESAREKAYQLFLNFMAFQNVSTDDSKSVKLSEEEFEHFLQKIHVSRTELKQISVKKRIVHRQIRTPKNELMMVREPVKVTAFSKEQHQSDIIIYRIDYLHNSEKDDSFYYTYQLPGISIDEVLSYDQTGRAFWHNKLTRYVATEYFQLLEEERLVKHIRSPVLLYLDEVRFEIANNALRGFIISCTYLLTLSIERMHLTWKNFRPPKVEEEKWFSIFWGKTKTKIILEELRQYRLKQEHQLQQLPFEERKSRRDQQKKEIMRFEKGMQIRLNKIEKDYSQVLADYAFLADVLLEWIYPSLLRELQKNDKI